MKLLGYLLFSILLVIVSSCRNTENQSELYNLDVNVVTRSITYENQTGEPGEGGKAASEIGVGRKGSPAATVDPGTNFTMCNIKGSGTIHHIWIAGGPFKTNSFINEDILRSTLIRVYWDNQEHPSIECPLGDFFGLAHGKVIPFQSAIHSVGKKAALNIWLPMPFEKQARIEFVNEGDKEVTLFYQIDYSLNVKHPKNFGRLHVLFRRENPTIMKKDFEIFPKRIGSGRFIGAVIGVRSMHPGWWGEGEAKFYMDGDTDYPTICGTGSEDYIALSYGVQQTPFLYHGCNLHHESDSTFMAKDLQTGELTETSYTYTSMYRWHLLDPIYWKKECRVTMQQIGCCLYDRDDDWSTATFWYEKIPSGPLPPIPSKEERLAGLEGFINKRLW